VLTVLQRYNTCVDLNAVIHRYDISMDAGTIFIAMEYVSGNGMSGRYSLRAAKSKAAVVIDEVASKTYHSAAGAIERC
jgi:hypothetical protein